MLYCINTGPPVGSCLTTAWMSLVCLSHCIMCQLIRLGAVLYKHWASSGFLPYNSMDVTGLCLHHCIMCQLIRLVLYCINTGPPVGSCLTTAWMSLVCLSHCIMCQLIRLGAVLYKHWASSGFLPYNSMDVTGLSVSLYRVSTDKTRCCTV